MQAPKKHSYESFGVEPEMRLTACCRTTLAGGGSHGGIRSTGNVKRSKKSGGRRAGRGRCLFGVVVADVLKARAVVDVVRVQRQVVLAEGALARLAGKQQPARLAGRAPTLPAVVVRAHPPLGRLQLLLTWPSTDSAKPRRPGRAILLRGIPRE